MGVNAALITIYDLSKIVNPHLRIDNVRLLIKEGGKSGLWKNPDGLCEILCILNNNVKTKDLKIIKDWIDYNDHMNVSYYLLIFDKFGVDKLNNLNGRDSTSEIKQHYNDCRN